MSARIRRHIRSNVVGYMALFVALSGTAYATHPGGVNTISSADIINGEVRNDDLGANAVGSGKIADRSVKNADLSIGASSSNTIADGGIQSIDVANNSLGSDDIGIDAVGGSEPDEIADLSVHSADIANDAVGSAKIENVTRSINLPLASFMDLSISAPIDFDSSNSAHSPDFVAPSGLGLFIAFDDDSAATDTNPIASTFFVPQDYAASPTVALRVSKDAETTAASERIACNTSVNGSLSLGGNSVEITSAGSTAYTIPLPELYATGDSAIVHCGLIDAPDDIVRIHSVELRYTATQ